MENFAEALEQIALLAPLLTDQLATFSNKGKG